MAVHANLTGANLHEPKGVASASAGTVYSADGAGSGSWAKVGSTNIDSSSIFGTNEFVVTAFYDDIGTAGSIYVVMPWACTITRVRSIIQGAITTANNVFTIRNTAGSSMGTITVTQAGSAAGDIDILDPASNNTIAADAFIKIDSDGGTANTADAFFTITATRTA